MQTWNATARRRGTCAWDAVEVVLKASFDRKERPLLWRWREAYRVAFAPCFPRLHVITDGSRLGAARLAFPAGKSSSVPNVTFRANHLAPAIERAKHPSSHSNRYYIMQWHAMWADNFTSAPWVLVYDVDAIPALPLRCHHLFTSDGGAKYYSWLWHHPSPWSVATTRALLAARGHGTRFASNLTMALTRGRTSMAAAARAEVACMQNASRAAERLAFYPLDLMTLFPIVIPTRVLPSARELVRLGTGAAATAGATATAGAAASFDEAFVRLVWPSHADLIGKAALLLLPRLIRLVHCPSNASGRARRDDELGGDPFECATLVAHTEHVRHPVQGAASHGQYLATHAAAARADRIQTGVRAFMHGERDALPDELFHYAGLAPRDKAAASRAAMREDPPGSVCGSSASLSGSMAPPVARLGA